MLPKISVVIPVYNAARYLKRCLNSVLAQQYDGELELICVNDGSTGDSEKILHEFAQKNSNIKIINQSNKGAAAARNAGMDAASGKYVSFVDADDYLFDGVYLKFAQIVAAEDVDIYMFNGITEDSKTGIKAIFFSPRTFKPHVTENDCVNYKDIADFFYGNQGVWNKIYRAEFLREHHFKMKEHSIFEDTLFNFATMINAQKIRFTYQNFYHYTQNPQSVTQSIGANAVDLLSIFEDMEKEAQKRGLDKFFSYALFQLEYEKIIETLSMTKPAFRQNFFEKSQEFLRNRIGKLDAKIYLKLININFGLALLNYNYEQICDTLLLSKDSFHFSAKKSKEPLFSIIVPVYNVQRFLPLCLKSLTNQSYDDFEIICVNDGSTDNSLALLEQYAQADARICVINQKNKGLGGARNTGVRAAKGKYLLFVDSDDWLSLSTLQILSESIKQNPTDLCLFGISEFIDQTMQILPCSYMNTYSGLEKCDLTAFADKMYINTGTWNKLYDRKFFVENNLFFAEKVYFEDILIHTKALVLAKSISFCRHNLYYYRIRANSIIHSGYSEKKLDDLIKAFVDTSQWLKQLNIYDTHKKCLADFAKINFDIQLNYWGAKYANTIHKKIKENAELQNLLT